MLADIQLIYFLKKLYDWNEVIVAVIGVVISTVFLFVTIPKKKAAKILLAILPGTIMLILSLCIHSVKKHYTYVPNINLTKESLAQVYSQLNDAGLWYSDDHITVDKQSMKYLKTGEDLMNHSLKVTDCNPKPGEFVKKETVVELSVSWFDEITTINLEDSSMKNFDAKEFYGNLDLSTLETYNTFSIQIRAQPAALKEIVADTEKLTTTYPTLAEESIVEIELMDYTTNEVVDKAICYLGDEITFPLIQKGFYYFTVSCDGYQIALSEYPFHLEYDDSAPIFTPYWYVSLEKAEDAYSSPFKILLQDKQGKPLSNTKVHMYVDSEDDSSSKTEHWSPFFVTDKNGYLYNNKGDYSLPGGIVKFQVLNGYFINIYLDDDEKLIPVYPTGNDEVCIKIM